ncbi:hypothetical protein [Bdellovibrio sp. HCB-162]|uniref:hypothetical protein n=1 Tax=Bdellovibrio sp. HCB-162 TaxID=3394234 RepID=UPI0039BCF81C
MSAETQIENSSVDSKEKASASKKTKDKETKEKITKKSVLKKLETETAKLLEALKATANKKEFGRKIRDSEIIHIGLTLVKPEHLEGLKESTYSEKDRLQIVYLEYQKEHGKLTLDQFIGKLLNGEVIRGSEAK